MGAESQMKCMWSRTHGFCNQHIHDQTRETTPVRQPSALVRAGKRDNLQAGCWRRPKLPDRLAQCHGTLLCCEQHLRSIARDSNKAILLGYDE